MRGIAVPAPRSFHSALRKPRAHPPPGKTAAIRPSALYQDILSDREQTADVAAEQGNELLNADPADLAGVLVDSGTDRTIKDPEGCQPQVLRNPEA